MGVVVRVAQAFCGLPVSVDDDGIFELTETKPRTTSNHRVARGPTFGRGGSPVYSAKRFLLPDRRYPAPRWLTGRHPPVSVLRQVPELVAGEVSEFPWRALRRAPAKIPACSKQLLADCGRHEPVADRNRRRVIATLARRRPPFVRRPPAGQESSTRGPGGFGRCMVAIGASPCCRSQTNATGQLSLRHKPQSRGDSPTR